ncbi:MAG: phosphatase PAP2 family protein [Candidatus Dormibacteraeota bacterium]|nr:phosphatase PAP2 family protein [Candidatus Dormibacteraeota bacterium]
MARAETAHPTPPPAGAQEAAKEVISGRPQQAARWWLGWVSLVALIAFGADSYLVINGTVTRSFDAPIEGWVQSFNWGPVATVMQLTNASSGLGQVLLGVGAVVALFIWERRAGLLMALGSIGSGIDYVVKVSVARHRPTADLAHILDPSAGYSFPSGHAVFFTWFAFILAVAVSPHVRPSRRVLVWGAAAALIFVACLGRVWGGAHWPSDVIGGFLLGLGWSAFVMALPERWLPAPSWSGFMKRFRRA